MSDQTVIDRAATQARRDTRAYAPPRAVAARPDEQPPIIVPLGTLAGPARQAVLVAPCPCRITRLGLVARSDVPYSLGNGWDVIWRRQPADFWGTAYRDIVLADDPLRLLMLDDPVPVDDDEEGSSGGSEGDPPPDPEGPPSQPLDEATGTTTGAFVGVPTFEVDGPPVDMQLAIALDGTGSQYATVDLGTPALADGGAMDVWFRPDAAIVSGERHLIGLVKTADGSTATGAPGVVLRTSKDGQANGLAALVGGVQCALSAQWQGWEPARWNLVSLSWTTPGDLVIRCNGVEVPVTRTAGATMVDEALTMVIGKRRPDAAAAYSFAGRVAGVAIYDHPLDVAAHRRRYHAIAAKSTRLPGGDLVSGRPWTTAGMALDATHRLLNTGDTVWLEATPLYAGAALLDASAVVAFEVI